MRRASILIFFIVIQHVLIAQNIKISIYNDHSLRSFIYYPINGTFQLKSGETIIDTLNQQDVLYFTLLNNEIAIRKKNHLLGSYETIELIPLNNSALSKIRPVSPSLNAQFYDDKISIQVDFNRLLVVNEIETNKYLAGVVEAEGGPSATKEFYKAQALLCRTYAFQNIERHIEEGFNLCDGVHCQAYKGKKSGSRLIYQSVVETGNNVVVTHDSELITAAFHSNSGGKTEDAKNVWVTDLPYLKPVNDPFSLKGRNSNWEKTITRAKWETYLKQHNFFLKGNEKPGYFSSEQNSRQKYYKVGLDILSYQRIRKEWLLRSAYFSIIDDGKNITFKGKGYGHGVGMSQEGAMQMSKAGYRHEDIIHYYFKDVKIVDYESIVK
jgi:stage II sporulation protein D